MVRVDKKRAVQKKPKKTNSIWNRPLFVSKDKEYFVENMSMLLAAGMNIVDVLKSIKEEVRSKAMKRVVDNMRLDIEAGSPLWKAVDRTKLFPTHTIALMRIGEEAGRLSQNLDAIALQEQKDSKFKSKVRSALLYPVFVLSLTVVVGVGVAWFVLPRLSSVFDTLNLQLPLLTRWLIALGGFLGEYGWFVVPVFFALFAALIFLFFFNSATRWIGQEVLFRIPGVKRLIQEVELARMGFLLGTLIDSGMPIQDALVSLRKATQARGYEKFYAHLVQSIEEGNSFQKSFATYPKIRKLIPAPIRQMIIASEQSGSLSGSLLKIGAIYEAKIEITTKSLTTILEPILLVIVWLGVVVVALAVISPLYSLLSGIN